MVLGDDGPAVGQQAHVTLARVHHRLDGEGHTRLQLEPGTGLAVVQHLRVFVIHTPDAMAAVLAHHRVVVFLDEALDGVTDVAQVGTGTSILTMSPAFRRLSFGMPWHTTWFTEVQMVLGKPR